MASGSSALTAVFSLDKKEDSILWEIQDVRQVVRLLMMSCITGATSVNPTLSLDISNMDNQFECVLEFVSNDELMLSLNIKFLNKTKKERFHHQEQGAPSVGCMTVTIFDPKEQKWDRIFIKWFCTYRSFKWTEKVSLCNHAAEWLKKFASEEGSVKLGIEVTEHLRKGSEFCTIKISENGTNLDIISSSRKSNILARDNLIRDFGSLLGDEATSDLKISVCYVLNDERRVKVFCCHKVILSARNEVFRRMLESKEMKEGKDGHIEISDISINAMEWFLRYLYTGVVMRESEDAEEEQRFFKLLPEIAYIADKYNDGHLKNVCDTNLHRSATPENIRDLMLCARLHGLTEAESELRKVAARDPYKYLEAMFN